MLSRITGVLESLESPPSTAGVVVPEGQPGLGYEVLLPGYLADSLRIRLEGGSALGVTLFVLEYLESLNQGASFVPRLIGFGSAREREFFQLMTSVKGLGNKRALRAMAVVPGVIARAIAERDSRRLQGLPEIGPKLAELIVHELKGKVDGFVGLGGMVSEPEARIEPKAKVASREKGGVILKPKPAKPSEPARMPPVRNTVDALVALGETPMDAERMVARAVERARNGEGELPLTTEELLAAAYAAR